MSAQGTCGGTLWQRTTPFLEARPDVEGACAIVVGVPMDHTTSFRPGTREAPRRIRDVSDGLEAYSPALGRSLGRVAVADVGDLILPWGNVETALGCIEQAMDPLLRPGGPMMVVLGGEHLLTLGVMRSVVKRWPDLAVVQLDAHLDLREQYLGQRLSHATVMRRVSELVGGLHSIVPMGVRSGDEEEWRLWRETHRLPEKASPVEAAEAVREWLGSRPFYLTIDIDVVDPGFAPGTGTPEPGGWSAREALDVARILGSSGPIAVDVVEVCPARDPADVTSLLAAKMVREVLLAAGTHVRG